MEKAALAEEVMIPIRLDIDLDSFKIKDAFMWNMNGRPAFIARLTCNRGISDTRPIRQHYVLRLGYPASSLCVANF